MNHAALRAVGVELLWSIAVAQAASTFDPQPKRRSRTTWKHLNGLPWWYHSEIVERTWKSSENESNRTSLLGQRNISNIPGRSLWLNNLMSSCLIVVISSTSASTTPWRMKKTAAKNLIAW
eukprot:symbB.v1.2.017456.t1/scaffold1364.1/size123310/8